MVKARRYAKQSAPLLPPPSAFSPKTSGSRDGERASDRFAKKRRLVRGWEGEDADADGPGDFGLVLLSRSASLGGGLADVSCADPLDLLSQVALQLGSEGGLAGTREVGVYQ